MTTKKLTCIIQGLFQGGQLGDAFHGPPPSTPTLSNLLSLHIYLIWGRTPEFVFAPLKFAAMHLPPLERDPEINPSYY